MFNRDESLNLCPISTKMRSERSEEISVYQQTLYKDIRFPVCVRCAFLFGLGQSVYDIWFDETPTSVFESSCGILHGTTRSGVEENISLQLFAHVFVKTEMCYFHAVVLQRTARVCSKVRAARAA